MRLQDFLNLVPIHEITQDPEGLYPEASEFGMYRAYIALDDIIDVFQRSGFEIKKKKITLWSIAHDLAVYTRHFGDDEAHQALTWLLEQRGLRKKKEPKKPDLNSIKKICESGVEDDSSEQTITEES